MDPVSPTSSRRWIGIIFALAVLVLAVLCLFLFLQLRTVPRAAIVQNYRHHHLPPFPATSTPPSADVSQIQTWMTFDYLNHIFNLPPQYLQSALSISDERYPSLSINQYAAQMHLTSANAVSEVQNAVKAYAAKQS